MGPSYFVVIVLSMVVIVEAKYFIGDCSYGFCEQKCSQIEEFKMECLCERGYILKHNGRSCVKKFVTDDEISGDDASGEEMIGNCDNEDDNCDKTTGTEIIISGDGNVDEEGSGSLLSSIIKGIGTGKTRIDATSTLTRHEKTKYSISTSKIISEKTSSKIIVKVPTTPIKSSTVIPIKVPTTPIKSSKVIPVTTTPIKSSAKTPVKVPTTPMKSSAVIPVEEPTTTIKSSTRISVKKPSTSTKIVTVKSVQVDDKYVATKTSSIDIVQIISKIPPVIEDTVHIYTKTLYTPTRDIEKTVKTQIDKKDIKTSSVKRIIATERSKDITGIEIPSPKSTSSSLSTSLKTTVVHKLPLPSPRKTSPIVTSSTDVLDGKVVIPLSSSSKSLGKIIVQTRLVEKDKPVVMTSIVGKPQPKSKPKPSPIETVTSSVIATSYIGKKILPGEGKSAIDKYIPVKPIATSSRVKPSASIVIIHKSKTTTMTTEQPRTTNKVPTTKEVVEIKKVVVQGDDDDVPEYVVVYNKTKSSSSVSATATIIKSIPSIEIPKKAIPSNTSIVVELSTSTKVIKPVGKVSSVEKTVVKDSISSKTEKGVESKIRTSVSSSIRVSRTLDSETRQLKKTAKEAISSLTPKSSFIAISFSTEIVKKTTPLQIVRTHTVMSSSSSMLHVPSKKSTSVVKELSKTDVIVDGKVIRPSSTKSVERSRTSTVKLDVKKSTSKLLPKEVVSSSSSKRKPEHTEKDVIQSSPTKQVRETKRVIVIQASGTHGSESLGCTLVVNKYLLTLGTLFTIYFLRVN